jgi:hypothetical protein
MKIVTLSLTASRGAANAPRRKDSKANGQRARQARHDARGMTPFGDVDDVFEMKR